MRPEQVVTMAWPRSARELSDHHAMAARSLIDMIAQRASQPGGVDLPIDQVIALANLHAQLAIHAELECITEASAGLDPAREWIER